MRYQGNCSKSTGRVGVRHWRVFAVVCGNSLARLSLKDGKVAGFLLQ